MKVRHFRAYRNDFQSERTLVPKQQAWTLLGLQRLIKKENLTCMGTSLRMLFPALDRPPGGNIYISKCNETNMVTTQWQTCRSNSQLTLGSLGNPRSSFNTNKRYRTVSAKSSWFVNFHSKATSKWRTDPQRTRHLNETPFGILTSDAGISIRKYYVAYLSYHAPGPFLT